MNARLMRFRTAVIKDGEMWCVPSVLNWLFRINLNDWSVEGICDLGTEGGFWMESVMQYQNDIWCVSNQGLRVAGHNILTGETEHFEMTKDDRTNLGAVEYRGTIWIIPRNMEDSMICFDVNKKRFSIHEEWEKACRRNGLEGVARSVCFVNHTIYLIIVDRGEIVRYDLEKREFKAERIKIQGKPSFQYIFRAHNAIYITSHVERKLIRWNEKTGETKEFVCPYLQDRVYINAMEFERGILLIGKNAENGRTIDFFDISVERISPYMGFSEELSRDEERGTLFYDNLAYDGRYFLIPWKSNKLFEYHRKSGEWKSHSLEVPKEIFERKYILKKLEKHLPFVESEMPLENFFNYLRFGGWDGMQETRQRKNVGGNIYSALIKD